MAAEIISVGTELLLGEIANTDAQYISECLSELGIDLYYHTVVGDNVGRLTDVLRLAKSRSDLIITTGGLGPTYDDLTKEVICKTLGLELELHEPSLERMRRFFADLGKEMTDFIFVIQNLFRILTYNRVQLFLNIVYLLDIQNL